MGTDYMLKILVKKTLYTMVCFLQWFCIPIQHCLFRGFPVPRQIYIFRSGAMGDLLLLYDSISYAQSRYSLPPITVVSKSTSITRELISLYSSSRISLINYTQFLAAYFSNINSASILIDTEPYFPFGKIIALLSVYKNPQVAMSVNSLLMNMAVLSSRHSYTFPYSNNSQESLLFLSLILSSLEYFKVITPSSLLLEAQSFTSHIQSPLFLNSSSAAIPVNLYQPLSTKSMGSIYLYYGCSKKARHRLPTYQFLLMFLRELSTNYTVHLVGGPSELFLVNTEIQKYATTSLIDAFPLSVWSSFLSKLEYRLPFITFDGGFAHFMGLYTGNIFQIFCSSNPLKWKHKSTQSTFFFLDTPCSPCNKPYLLQVPNSCAFGNNACSQISVDQLISRIQDWMLRP